MPRFSPALLAAALAAALTLSACSPREEPKPTPKLTPPAIGAAGILKVGVDLGYPPFAGTDKGVQAGLDVDVAAAVADHLGLTLTLVDLKPSQMATALADGRIDVGLGAIPLSESTLLDMTFAGSYAVDGPAFFSAKEETVTLDNLGGRLVGVQEESAAQWVLETELGSEAATRFPSLRDAFTALADGQIEVVAADAIVGAYIARDFPGVRFVGQVQPAAPLGVYVRKDSEKLEGAVRGALDALSAAGVLEQLRSKWSTTFPELRVRSPLDEDEG